MKPIPWPEKKVSGLESDLMSPVAENISAPIRGSYVNF